MPTLTDVEIEKEHLVYPFVAEQLSTCCYNLTAERAFEPTTGNELAVKEEKNGETRHIWSIGPSETLVIMTKERITLPEDVYATYSQLNELVSKGLLLMNTSLIEPGYKGRLSCFLVNFSKEPVCIWPGRKIAKICFNKLSSKPARPRPDTREDGPYVRMLAEAASRYPKSFMDIGEIEKRAEKRATETIKKTLTWSGVGIGALLLWATLEPMCSRWIYEKTGLVDAETRTEIQASKDELNEARSELESALDTKQKMLELKKQNASDSDADVRAEIQASKDALKEERTELENVLEAERKLLELQKQKAGEPSATPAQPESGGSPAPQ